MATTASAARPLLSVVVPVYNEQAALAELDARLRAALAQLAEPCEIVYVDDGSSDASIAILEGIVAAHPDTTLVELSRNFGKEPAMLAGYDHAAGRAVVVVDADLQTPPELIGPMVAAWRAGAEIVDAVRSDSHVQGALRRLTSWGFYWLMRRAGGHFVVPNCADFRLMDARVVEAVRRCRERRRFNRGLVGWTGFRRQAIAFQADQRRGGGSRWGIGRLLHYAMDALFSFSGLPVRVVGAAGAAVTLISLLLLLGLLLGGLVAGGVSSWALLAAGLFLLGGLNLGAIALVGEYVVRLADEIRDRPVYLARRVIGRHGRAAHTPGA